MPESYNHEVYRTFYKSTLDRDFVSYDNKHDLRILLARDSYTVNTSMTGDSILINGRNLKYSYYGLNIGANGENYSYYDNKGIKIDHDLGVDYQWRKNVDKLIDVDIIRIASDSVTISKLKKKTASYIEIHHPFSYRKIYLKLNLKRSYNFNGKIQLDSIESFFKPKESQYRY